MITDLKLKGNKLLLFAIIYGFTQDEEQEFAGSLNYIREWLGGASKNTVIATLNELIDRKLIIKRQEELDGVVTNYYRINADVINSHLGAENTQCKNYTTCAENEQGSSKTEQTHSSKIEQGSVQKLIEPSAKTEPNKYIYNNNINITNKDLISMCGASDDTPPHTASPQPQSKKSTKEPKHRYGEYQHVLLTDTETEKLKTEYGVQLANEAVTFLDEYIEMKGYSAKSHYLCIRKWVVNAIREKQERDMKASPANQTLTKSEQNNAAFDAMFNEFAAKEGE